MTLKYPDKAERFFIVPGIKLLADAAKFSVYELTCEIRQASIFGEA